MLETNEIGSNTAVGRSSTRIVDAISRVWDRMGILLVLLLLVVIFTALAPSFLELSNIKAMIVAASTTWLLAAGVTYQLIAGQIDLSFVAVGVFSGVVTAQVLIWLARDDPAAAISPSGSLAKYLILGVLVSTVVGVGWGLLNGVLVTGLRIPSLIVTLGTLGMASGLAAILADGVGVTGIPVVLQENFGLREVAGVPVITLVCVAVFVVAWLVLAHTKFGLHTYAIGSDSEAAKRAGLHVTRHIILIYALMGSLAGLVAFLNVSRFGTAAVVPDQAVLLGVVAAVIIGGTSLFGGRGRMWGTVIGVLIPVVLQNGFVVVGLESFWQTVAVGIVLIAAVYLDQLRLRLATGRAAAAAK